MLSIGRQFLRFPLFRGFAGIADFASTHSAKAKDGSEQKATYGRPWAANELRLKSSSDLHKLWYVLLKEKNAVLSDQKVLGNLGYSHTLQDSRIQKVQLSMRRIHHVISERNNVQQLYRRKLEDDYIEAKRREEIVKKEEENEVRPEVELPAITFELLRSKYRSLRRGVDNIDYITQALNIERQKREKRQELHERYNYDKQKIYSKNFKVPEGENEKDYLKKFNNSVQRQFETGELEMTNLQVLQAHVKNWKSLTLRQRRVVTNLLHARRANEAKEEFLKELDLLGQKIAYDKAHQ